MQICLFRCRGDHCKRLFLMSLSSRTKAFSRGEGGALPAMMLSSIESVRNSCGCVTEEGKRTCPLADRPILEAHRLPSSVTAPQSFLLV